MKKLLLSVLTASLLTSGAMASNSFINSDYEAKFQEMQKFFDSMVASNLTHAKIGNLGYPRVNSQNTKESYIYEFDLAGVAKENIKLSIDENNILTLSGKKESKTEEKQENYMKQEIYYGSFSRMIKLPDDINQEKITTEYNNGILKLTIGKKELKKPKSKILEIK